MDTMLETQTSGETRFSTDSWSTGESSHRSTDSGRGGSSSGSSSSSSSSTEGGSYLCIATLSGHSGPVASLAVVGDKIYSGGADSSEIRVWSQPEMVEVSRFRSGDGAVKSLVVDGDHIFSAHQDRKIRVWKFPSTTTTTTTTTSSSAAAAGVPGKGPKLVASLPTLKDYLLRCVPPNNYVQVRRNKRSLWIQHNDAISVLALGAIAGSNGNVLYSGSWDKSIKVWRTTDFRCLESINRAHDDAVSSLVADQQGFLYSSSADGTVKVWTKTKKKHTLVGTLKEQGSSAINALVLSHDESLLYAASSNKTVSVWERTKKGGEDVEQGEGEEEEAPHMKLAGLLRGHRQAVLCMASVGDILCTGSADKTIRVWRRNGGSLHSLVTVLEGHCGPVRSVCASTEAVETGVVIYSGSIDRSVKVWWLAPPKDSSSEDEDCVLPPSAGSISPPLLKWTQSSQLVDGSQ